MHDEAIEKGPACVCLRLDAGKLFLRHAGIMLERHGGHRVRCGLIAHGSDECGDGAHICAAASQCGNLGADVEILALNANYSCSLLRSYNTLASLRVQANEARALVALY